MAGGNKGGARPGAGRPTNAAKYGEQIAELNDAIAANVTAIFEKGMELVRGVEIQRPGPQGTTRVYTEPPNAKMIIFFLEKLAGKAVQALEHSGPGGGAIPLNLSQLPTGDLDDLERIARRLADGRSEGGPPGD